MIHVNLRNPPTARLVFAVFAVTQHRVVHDPAQMSPFAIGNSLLVDVQKYIRCWNSNNGDVRTTCSDRWKVTGELNLDLVSIQASAQPPLYFAN